jgi:hypothetical protein
MVMFCSFSVLMITACDRVAPWPTNGVFAGYYESSFERSDFKPVGTGEQWWITGDTAPLRGEPTLNPAYVVVRGTLSSKGRYGHLTRMS